MNIVIDPEDDREWRAAAAQWRSEVAPVDSSVVGHAVILAAGRARRRSRVAIAGAVAAVAVLAGTVVAVQRGPTQTTAAAEGRSPVALGAEVTAQGTVFRPRDGDAYLCAETGLGDNPGATPECVGARLTLIAVQGQSVDWSGSAQFGTRWTANPQLVTGTVVNDTTVAVASITPARTPRPQPTRPEPAWPCIEGIPAATSAPGVISDQSAVEREIEANPARYSGVWRLNRTDGTTTLFVAMAPGQDIAAIRRRVSSIYTGDACLVQSATSAAQRQAKQAGLEAEHPGWWIFDAPLTGGLIVAVPVYTAAVAAEIGDAPEVAAIDTLAAPSHS